MKVLLVGNYVPDQQQSMLGFANALAKRLPPRGLDVRLISPQARIGGRSSGHAGLNKWLAYVDKYLLFPRELRRAAQWADVVHVCDQANGIYVNYLHGLPHLVTCHDLMAFRAAHGEIAGWRVGWSGKIYQRLILGGLKRAQNILCDSEATQRDVTRFTHLPLARTPVVLLALLSDYSPMETVESERLLREMNIDPCAPFLLHIGSNQPSKNRIGVLKIYSHVCEILRQREGNSPPRLVMAGKAFNKEMRVFADAMSSPAMVLERANPTQEQLRALYSRAAALIFPSLLEGFGLPIIEAQACGCPVFTTNLAPMTEVGGKGAIYINPAEPATAAEVITSHLAEREAMTTAGFENVKRFTTERMIDDYVRAYKRVLSDSAA